jgi:CHAT domain-containing protein/Tfp pilus assembly protein PilF
MRQQRLMLGLSIVLLLTWGKTTLPGIAQSLPPTPNLENGELAEAKQLDQQVINLYSQGKYQEAIPLAQRALTIWEKVRGKDHPDVANGLNNLAVLYRQQGKYDGVELLLQRSLAIWEKARGKNHPDVAISLDNLAGLYESQGKYTQAKPLYQRALVIREKALGKDHPDVAISLNNLAGLYESQGKYAQAEPLYQRSLVIKEKVLGKDHPGVTTSLNNLAVLYRQQGKYAEAEPLLQRALTIWEKNQGKDHPSVATSLNNLAGLYEIQGKYDEAVSLYKRSLAIREKVLGKDHPDVAISLNNLAGLYDRQGKYEEAEKSYKRSLSILEQILGKDHINVANILNNLAALYRKQGEYIQAEPLYKRSLGILEKVWGENHQDFADSLNNLAVLYRNQGKYTQAEPLFQRSLTIREKVLGKDHPDVAISLNNLAELYNNQGKYTQAESLYKRSLSTLEKKWGKDHPSVATSLNNLAELYRNQGKYAQAESLFQNSLTTREKVLGKNHPDVATSLNNLATLYDGQKKYAQAEPLYIRSLEILEKNLGQDHPSVATNLSNLAALYDTQEKFDAAVVSHDRASEITDRQLSKTLLFGSERDKKDYVDNILTSPDFSVSLAIKSNRLDAKKLAITNVLRRQGRILDATAATIQSIRPRLKDRPDLQRLFDDWKLTLQKQSNLTNSQINEKSSQSYQTRYQELANRQQELESQLGAESAIFRQAIAPVKLVKVQTLVPQNAALIHLVRYLPHNSTGGASNRFGLPRYTAAILRSTGDPHWIDLGTATEIEQNIQKFRAYLQDGSNTSNRQRQQLARTLHTQLIQPLRQHLGDAKHLLLSPDAALNLIPFEALQDTDNKYLIEQYTFSYLTSGRDLLRFPAAPPSRQAPVVFSEIDYQDNFSPLATQAETNQIQTIFPNAQIIRDRAATKTALQQVQAPQILHLATHGFFKPVPKDTTANLDNPLTRSGIVLAGANSRSGAGILTGLEASALDLYGTQLVVLSACETGLGDISAGEGIYGLRRALLIAGSQSQVLSLWKVGDAATVELMKLFYQNLKAGMGRHQALRDAQLKLLQHPNYQNPHNWAAFIPSGNWEPLSKASP